MEDVTLQSKGGLVRAESLSPEQRSDIARKAALSRWSVNIPRAITRTSPLKIGDVQMACAVLENETRILTQKAFCKRLVAFRTHRKSRSLKYQSFCKRRT